MQTNLPAPGLACQDHDLPLGSDVDNAALQHLAVGGKIADLVWEAYETLAAEHSQAFRSARQAYQVGNAELAEQQWRQARAI
jgi:hypothetical protein